MRHKSPGSRVPRGTGAAAAAAVLATLVAACSSQPTQRARGPAQPGAMASGVCERLGATFSYPGVVITESTSQPAGSVQVDQTAVDAPAHCVVRGRMGERTSPVNQKVYSLGFEMRLPREWNGRFMYQGNGGTDGVVVPAVGPAAGGGDVSRALSKGFAVLSSDAGHSADLGPRFGVDPQARLDYGYQAVGKLTPMAKRLVASAYGRPPDWSYIAGCSNGGRHAMVAASRYPEMFDGYLAGNPGIHLPQASLAQVHGLQQYARVAPSDAQGKMDLDAAVSAKEFSLLGNRVLEKCDMLDGARDGMVLDPSACQREFNMVRDVPECAVGVRDGTCLSAQQKLAVDSTITGATTVGGNRLYSPFWYDPGIAGRNWAQWDLGQARTRSPGNLAFLFSTPPVSNETFGNDDGLSWARTVDMDSLSRSMQATGGPYEESAVQFMTPPDAEQMSGLGRRGSRMIVYHGTADPLFSPVDTIDWYRAFDKERRGQADQTARLFLVPQMNHCSGGPAADRFDLLTPLVKWVEDGVPPTTVESRVRGGSGPAANSELPQGWSPNRARPLCPYPRVPRYRGSGDIESAESFYCAEPAKEARN